MNNEHEGDFGPTKADEFSAQLGPMERETSLVFSPEQKAKIGEHLGNKRNEVCEQLAEGSAEIAAVSEIEDEFQALDFLEKFDILKSSKLREIGSRYDINLGYDDSISLRKGLTGNSFYISGHELFDYELPFVADYLNGENITEGQRRRYERFSKDLLKEILEYSDWYNEGGYQDHEGTYTGRTLDAAVSAGIIRDEKAQIIREAEKNGKIILTNAKRFHNNEILYREYGPFRPGHQHGWLPKYENAEKFGYQYEGEQLWYVIADPEKKAGSEEAETATE